MSGLELFHFQNSGVGILKRGVGEDSTLSVVGVDEECVPEHPVEQCFQPISAEDALVKWRWIQRGSFSVAASSLPSDFLSSYPLFKKPGTVSQFFRDIEDLPNRAFFASIDEAYCAIRECAVLNPADLPFDPSDYGVLAQSGVYRSLSNGGMLLSAETAANSRGAPAPIAVGILVMAGLSFFADLATSAPPLKINMSKAQQNRDALIRKLVDLGMANEADAADWVSLLSDHEVRQRLKDTDTGLFKEMLEKRFASMGMLPMRAFNLAHRNTGLITTANGLGKMRTASFAAILYENLGNTLSPDIWTASGDLDVMARVEFLKALNRFVVHNPQSPVLGELRMLLVENGAAPRYLRILGARDPNLYREELAALEAYLGACQ